VSEGGFGNATNINEPPGPKFSTSVQLQGEDFAFRGRADNLLDPFRELGMMVTIAATKIETHVTRCGWPGCMAKSIVRQFPLVFLRPERLLSQIGEVDLVGGISAPGCRGEISSGLGRNRGGDPEG